MVQCFTNHTLVTFPNNSTEEQATVLFVSSLPQNKEKKIIFTDITPFHPRNYRNPDQPGDRGFIQINEETRLEVEQTLIAAVEKKSGKLTIDTEIQARRNDPNYLFLVGHVVSNKNFENIIGKNVRLSVDKSYRQALSEGHTACHLASLALNLATKDLWTKTPSLDSLNNPDFDRNALEVSKISEFSSKDKYRLGKTLRKKGFNIEKFSLNILDVQNKINEILRKWLQLSLNFSVLPSTSLLPEVRTWCCDLPEGTAKILCGGTHVYKFPEKTEIFVELKFSNPDLEMTTTVKHNQIQ